MGVGTLWILATVALIGGAAWHQGGHRARELQGRIRAAALAHPPAFADLSKLADLPPPVERYLRRSVPQGSAMPRLVTLRQEGELRADVARHRWSRFTATQLVAPALPAFAWEARIGGFPPLGVLDSYFEGEGAGQVALFSALRIDSAAGGWDLRIGSLLRFLAEAAWYPTALLPQAGVAWSALGESSALATLRDGRAEVQLEFRFDAAGDLAGIYSRERPRKTRSGFEPTPWEGRFFEPAERHGLRVPSRAEVGWHVAGRYEPVWRGRLVGLEIA